MKFHRSMLLPSLVGGAAVAVVASFAFRSTSQATLRHPVPFALSKASRSVDELADKLVAAVARNDRGALDALRMTEREYTDLVVPGTVDIGQPARASSDFAKRTFWKLLDKRSGDFGEALLGQFGGRRLHRVSIALSDEPKHYAWYEALGQLRVTAADDDGQEVLLRSGWVAEVNGDYKLIGLEWDD